jgi:hypothetical protein
MKIESLERKIVAGAQPFVLQVSPETRGSLLDLSMANGGARQAERMVSRWIGEPISAALSTDQIRFGDLVTVHGSETPFRFQNSKGGGFVVVNGEKTLHISEGKAQPPEKPLEKPLEQIPVLKVNSRIGDWLICVEDESEIPKQEPCPPEGVNVNDWWNKLPPVPTYPYVGSPEGCRPPSLFE